MNLYKTSKAFTLVEIMVGILIVSLIFIGAFQAMSAVSIGKIRLIQKTDIQKESLYFTQKLFEMIKKGGTIDYEEYFNRKVIGNTTYSSGHFLVNSGFGNFGSGVTVPDSDYGGSFYFCRSNLGDKMTVYGCISEYNNPTFNYNSNQQRYGQYSFQFIDYNSNYDDDGGDEDGDTKIRGDDDDEYLGDGPEAFAVGEDLTELYLLSGDKKERTFFRWRVEQDPDAPSSCDVNNDLNTKMYTGSGCIGTIEYLKLDGKDWGMIYHDNGGLDDNTRYDGLIDTWMIDPTFIGGEKIIAGTSEVNRVSLFPKTINVSEFKVYAYPHKDMGFSWKNNEPSVNISPYVILKFKLRPSWISRKKIQGEGEELDFSMTINLSEIYSQ
ncbi:MAG: prepilin-type N-terminal cleavage/methylation domain-containing protein [Candidatus Gracilibacteria bacterium]